MTKNNQGENPAKAPSLPEKIKMPKIKSLAKSLLLVALALLFATSCLATTAAAEDTVNDTASVSAENEKTTLSADQLLKISEFIKEQKVQKAGEQTVRDKFTAAYLANDPDAALKVINDANAALKDKNKLPLSLTSLTQADVTAIINTMKDTVETDKPSGLLELIKLAAGSVLNWFTFVVGGNYVLGLLIFAIVLELLMLPLSIKQQKNSIKQASLRPKEMAIRKKYAGRDDNATKQKMSQEIQEMYQRENFNPASGCLPLLIQFPVIIILYNVVINPIVYVLKLSTQFASALVTFAGTSVAAGGLGLPLSSQRGSIEVTAIIRSMGDSFTDKLSNFSYFSNSDELSGLIRDIGEFPNFRLFGVDLGKVPTISEPSWLWLIPVLTFFVYFGSMKLTKKFTYQPEAPDKATGCSNNVMDIMMPLFSVYICFIVPAALGIYWMFKSIIGTGTRFVLTKFMPIPQFTEEDYKAAEREIKGKGEPVPAVRTASGKTVRSLHHIDDEDFDDTREAALARKAKMEEEAAKEAAKLENSTLIKNDSDRPAMTVKELRAKIKENKFKRKEEENKSEADPNEKSGNNSNEKSDN